VKSPSSCHGMAAKWTDAISMIQSSAIALFRDVGRFIIVLMDPAPAIGCLRKDNFGALAMVKANLSCSLSLVQSLSSTMGSATLLVPSKPQCHHAFHWPPAVFRAGKSAKPRKPEAGHVSWPHLVPEALRSFHRRMYHLNHQGVTSFQNWFFDCLIICPSTRMEPTWRRW
jgi:hypothetical protein